VTDPEPHRAGASPLETQVGIVGAGPAGSTLAALLAHRGIQVVLIEQDVFPRDKLCGEFLSGEAESALEISGCRSTFLEAGPARISHARFTAASGADLQLQLPSPSYGISRYRLDAILLSQARACGAHVHDGTTVTRVETKADGSPAQRLRTRRVASPSEVPTTIACDLVALAQGRQSALDHGLDGGPADGLKNEVEREARKGQGAFVALKLHHRPRAGRAGRRLIEELTNTVEIHTFAGGYCGVSFVEDGVVNVCMLVRKSWLRQLATPRWPQICEAISACQLLFARRYEGLDPLADEVQTVARVSVTARRRQRPGCVFLGDACGMIAPLCGDGQAMAMEAAALLSPLAARALESPQELQALPRHWEQVWSRSFGRRLRIGRALQSLLLEPRRADLGLRLARRLPGLVARLARRTR